MLVNTKSTAQVINATLFVQSMTSLFLFLLTALLFAQLTHPKPFDYLGMRLPKKNIQWLIVVLLMLSCVPLINQVGEWLKHIDMGSKIKADYLANEERMRALISGTTYGDLALYLLIFGLLPAMGEELLFRGIIMKFSYNNSRNIHLAILLSAALFALAHNSAYTFLPIMFAGIILGYIYYLSGSIWLSIVAHFLNNVFAVLALFIANRSPNIIDRSTESTLPWYVVMPSLIIFIFAFFLLRKNATPLPSDWNDDFRGERQTNNP
jgi:hypothetical protein